MIPMNHLVIKRFLLFILIAMMLRCSDIPKEIDLQENLICFLLNKKRIDHRLDIIPSPESFNIGKRPYRLDKRPDSVPPLLVYVYDKTFEPNNLYSFEEKYDSLYKIYNRQIPVKNNFVKSKCEDFMFEEIADFQITEIKSDRIRRGNFFRFPSAVIIKLSNLFYNEEETEGVIYMSVTYNFMDSTYGSLIHLEKKDNFWKLKD